MRQIIWHKYLVWVLVVFFILGGVINFAAPTSIADDYGRWGYPTWFHYVTGAAELVCAPLLLRRDTRQYGAILGSLVMTAAVLTLALNFELTHAVVPVLVLIGLAVTFFGNLAKARVA